MLGLLLVYVIGKQFYELAHEFQKSRWGFAILGVAAYYTGSFLVGLAIGLSDGFLETDFLESTSDLTINLIAMPFGLLTCYLTYRVLKNKWEKNFEAGNIEILDDQSTGI